MGIDLTLPHRLVHIGSPRLHIRPYFALFRTGQLKHHGQTTSLPEKTA